MTKIKFMILCASLMFLTSGSAAKSTASASTLLIMRMRDQLWVAADSKTVDGQGVERPNQSCKIHRVGNLLLGIVGATADATEGWDVGKTAISIAKTQTSPKAIISTIVRRLDHPVQTSINKFKRQDRSAYRKVIVNGLIFTVVVMKMENGVATVYGAKVGIPENEEGPLRVLSVSQRCPGSGCFEPVGFLYAGYFDAVERFLEEDRKRIGARVVDPVELIESLVNLQITASPRIVGFPIDTAHMDKKGITWIHRKPNCPAGERYGLDEKTNP